jgi:hypothetical protein
VHRAEVAAAAEYVRHKTGHSLLGGTNGTSASAPARLSGEPRAGASDTGNQS